MRVLAVGDIHGCSRALDALIAVVAPTPDDIVIALGDFIDWGPDSSGVMRRLMELRSQTRLIGIRGNHEEMMLRSRANPEEHAIWMKAGGDVTLQSYGESGIPQSHWNLIETECVDSYETATHIFVHGGLSPDVPLAQQQAYMMRWKMFYNVKPHCSGKVMVCGHSTQRDGIPRSLGYAVCIDTGASAGGWLTCFEPEAGRYWQADQRGRTRRATIVDRGGA
jgi:serine/threonine protein phosphatase 1